VPFDERLWLDDDEGTSPIEETRQRKQHQTGRRRDSSRLRLALLEQSKLFTKKEILGDERPTAS